MTTKLRIKGHKLIASWGGCEDTYAKGRCECGFWAFDGWSERMRSVRVSHQHHLAKVRDGKPEFERHKDRPKGFLFPWQVGPRVPENKSTG